DSKALCNKCGENISRGGKNKKGFNTTNLRKHFETLYLKEQEVQDAARSSKEATPSQPTLKSVLEDKKSFAFDHPNSCKIHKVIGEMIALDNEPFSTFKRDGFKRLMKVMEPQYTLPSNKYFSETLYQVYTQ
uniref:BED-type domain-containing protein n=1 Tax=Amphimedon queenslandica TaxID=400682 RepID=A0A1X7T8V7_AMPQE